MIKVNELRIGNIFYPIQRNTLVHMPAHVPFKIIQIELFQVQACLFHDNIAQSVPQIFPIRDISGIPLTPEIVKKIKQVSFDFAENFTCYISRDGKILLEQYSEGQEELNQIKYLHQLQNLYYSLMDNDLEINL